MASGKKNYFRHSFFASEDQKLQRVIETMGFEGYGLYFALLELCGRQCADEVKNPVEFHVQTIRKVWRKNTESTKKVLRKFEESGLFLVTFSEHSVSVDIPNFGKYLGRYESNSPNKRKEKERKEKESKLISESEIEAKKILPSVTSQEILRKPSPLSVYFSDAPEIQEWLDAGFHETHLQLLKKYSHHEVVDLIAKAYAWALPRNQKAESWLYTFISNKSTQAYGANKSYKSKSRVTPGNPLGNPYLDDNGNPREELA